MLDPHARVRRFLAGRPYRCTSSFSLSYLPYQRVFNVGFRVVGEVGVTKTAKRDG